MNPALPRCAPFALFIALLVLASAFPLPWLTALRGPMVAVLLIWFWRQYSELRSPPPVGCLPWLSAAGVGLATFAAWIWLDPEWGASGERPRFDPSGATGEIDWPLASLRLAGLVLVVPVMEELFWRSFLLRWLRERDFLSLAPRDAGWRAAAITTLLFALEHHQWLAGALAGAAYAGLYMRFGSLWIPIAAHIITNGALGVWILATESWQYW